MSRFRAPRGGNSFDSRFCGEISRSRSREIRCLSARNDRAHVRAGCLSRARARRRYNEDAEKLCFLPTRKCGYPSVVVNAVVMRMRMRSRFTHMALPRGALFHTCNSLYSISLTTWNCSWYCGSINRSLKRDLHTLIASLSLSSFLRVNDTNRDILYLKILAIVPFIIISTRSIFSLLRCTQCIY